METTFHNVTISIEADSPQSAYRMLCELFDPMVATQALDYRTDTYTVYPTPEESREPTPTNELWATESR